MEKTVKFYGNNKDFLIYKGRKYYYEAYSGSIKWNFDIGKFLSDENYYNETVNDLEFNKYEINYIYNYKGKRLFLPISREFLEYYTTKDEFKNHNNILLSNNSISDNVDSFYEFSTEVEIENFRTSFQRSFAFEDMIYVKTPENENLKLRMNQIFGEPQNIPELENEKYGSGKQYFYYIIPISQINKIIGIKKHKEPSTIGQPDGEQFTGKTEEIFLDLHNFDENIYIIFKEHGMLEIF